MRPWEDRLREIALAAVATAADVMDSVDPDDRTDGQQELVRLTKELYKNAAMGDVVARDLLLEAVPSWTADIDADARAYASTRARMHPQG